MNFAHAVREELWSHGRRIESRLSHGQAVEDEHGIVATDIRDDALVALAERELARLREAMPGHATVRLVAEASTEATSATMIVRAHGLSIVTDAEHVHDDLALLELGARLQPAHARAESPRHVPIVWQNGTGAVLLHEAHGHPLEHGLAPLPLPPWLEVDVDLRQRRATFRDVPLPRMQHVRVMQHDAPYEEPPEFVEVHLVDGGSYDPLTDVVTVRISASSIGPFELREVRTNIRFLGARGEPRRYPGVVCSREGQELVVGSWAPALLTA